MLDSGLCVVHDSAHAVASRFAAGDAHTVGPGAPSKFDLWRDQVLQEFDVWIAPYRLALEANATATFQGQTFVDPKIADTGARIAAVEKVFDRLFGKATQHSEVSGPAGGPIELTEVPTSAERAAELAAILKSAGAL